MMHPDDMRYRYAVVVKCYRDNCAASWTQHCSLKGAIRSARSIIGGYKNRVETLETCRIWDKRRNALLSVSDAQRKLA